MYEMAETDKEQYCKGDYAYSNFKRFLVILQIALIIALSGGPIFANYSGWQRGYTRGWLDGYGAYEPKVITQKATEFVVMEVERVKEVEVPVSNEPREFESFRALCSFIKELDIEGHSQPDWDCDDFAYYVWFESIKAGYLMSFETEEINGALHACNSTVIGNVCYFIEPMGGKIWSKAHLD